MSLEYAIPGLMPVGAPKAEITPCLLRLEPHCAANTKWIGISSIGPITINNETPLKSAQRALLIFTPQTKYHDFQCLVFDSEEGGDGQVVIDSASAWLFSVPEQPLNVCPGMWDWELQIFDQDGNKETYYRGTLHTTP